MEKVKQVCARWTGSGEGRTWRLGPRDRGPKDGPSKLGWGAESWARPKEKRMAGRK